MARRKSKGEGGIYQEPGGSWRAIVYIDGKAIKRRAPTQEAAEALRRELLAQRNKGIDIGSGSQSLETWLLSWQESKARNLRPRSQDNNQRMIDSYIVPIIGATALNRLRADQLQRFLHRVQDDIVAESKGRYTGARTVRALAQVLNAALGQAVKRRLIEHNPMDGVEVPSYTAQEREPLTDDELRAVLVQADSHPLRPLWYLYGLIGLRRGEGLGLRFEDLDFDAGIMHVRQQVQEIDGKLVIGPPKYTSDRTIPLPGICIDLLRPLRAAHLARKLKRGPTWQDLDLVFCNRDGGPLWPSNVLEDFYALRNAAGAQPTATIHTLRHGVATLLDECGASDALKASILGHGKKTITQRYTHPRIEAMRRVLRQVEQRILSKPKEQAKEG